MLFYKKIRLAICLVEALLFVSTAQTQTDTLIICNVGEVVQLNAPQGQFAYQWSPTENMNNPTIYNPIVTPDTATTYVVKMIPGIVGDNLIANPDFEDGNQDFFSDYTFVGLINTQGVYSVNESAANLNPFFFEDCPDRTTGFGKMLVVDGSPEPNQRVWCQTIEVVPETDYIFSAWLTSVNFNNPALLEFSINGLPIGSRFRASFDECEWRQFFEIWNAGTVMEAEICIVNRNINPTGNDFAMDDFAFYELEAITYDTTVVLIEAVEAAKEQRMYFPTAFSPNQDGFNEHFLPYLGKGATALKSISIFNRWGNIVFERFNCVPNDMSCAWDGNQKQKALPNGLYLYTAEITFADGQTVIRSGEIWLLR